MKGERYSLLFLLLLITAISFLHTIKIMNRNEHRESRAAAPKSEQVVTSRALTMEGGLIR